MINGWTSAYFTEHRRVPQYRRSLILQKQLEAAPARARYSAAYAEYFLFHVSM